MRGGGGGGSAENVSGAHCTRYLKLELYFEPAPKIQYLELRSSITPMVITLHLLLLRERNNKYFRLEGTKWILF